MKFTRRILGKAAIGLAAATCLMQMPAMAQDKPAPFDNPGAVKIALVRYLSTGDFFQSYLVGAKAQAEALGVDLRVFDSRQDATHWLEGRSASTGHGLEASLDPARRGERARIRTG